MNHATLRRYVQLALSSVFLCACGAGRPSEEGTAGRERPDSSAPRPSPGLQPLRQLLQEYDSGLTDSTRRLVTDSADWVDVWRRAYARRGEAPPRPPVDFSKEVVALVALGTRPSGGFSIQIDSARATPETLEIFVRSVSPGPKCGAAAALTEPAAAAALPRSMLPAHFVETSETTDCR